MSDPAARPFVNFQLLRVDGSYHSLMANEKVVAKQEALAAFDAIVRRLTLSTYALTGLRSDCDILLWRRAASLEDLQETAARLQTSGMGKFMAPVYSFLGLAPDTANPKPSAPGRFLFLQPAIVASPADRPAVLKEFSDAARRHPAVRLHAIDSGGMDDSDFVFAFEADEPAAYAALAGELRASRAAGLLTRETPVFTCLQKDIRDIVDSIGA